MEKDKQEAKVIKLDPFEPLRQAHLEQGATPKNAFEELLEYFYPEEFQSPDPGQRA